MTKSWNVRFKFCVAVVKTTHCWWEKRVSAKLRLRRAWHGELLKAMCRK
ncbi:Uncharacterised protein [Vibrio cholerae]|nr:Uncharacterised protein [Vibrio cholerae]